VAPRGGGRDVSTGHPRLPGRGCIFTTPMTQGAMNQMSGYSGNLPGPPCSAPKAGGKCGRRVHKPRWCILTLLAVGIILPCEKSDLVQSRALFALIGGRGKTSAAPAAHQTGCLSNSLPKPGRWYLITSYMAHISRIVSLILPTERGARLQFNTCFIHASIEDLAKLGVLIVLRP
jgi:hypothetical protein